VKYFRKGEDGVVAKEDAFSSEDTPEPRGPRNVV
jgi:hypothetical protein